MGMSLTAKRVERLISRGTAGRYRDSEVRGLYLEVVNPNNSHWSLRYQLHGKEHRMGLGSTRDFTLREARERARRERQKLADKLDPLEVRRMARAEARAIEAKLITFASAAQSYFEAHQSKWRNATHRRQYINTLKEYVFPIIGNLPVAAIDVPLVLKVLEAHVPAARGYPAGKFWMTRTETASRVRGRIESVLDWAKARQYRTGDNPASWSVIGTVLPQRGKIAQVEHHAALPYAELPTFMATLRSRDGSAIRALEFTILTAARTGEVIGARWDEIDLKAATWTVPAGRMKASKEHRVPLSTTAIRLLNELPHEEGNPYPFVGPRSDGLSDAAMTAALKRLGRSDITVHGFRSTFRDWAAERTSFPNDVIEMALAHAVGNNSRPHTAVATSSTSAAS
jgi:integrase